MNPAHHRPDNHTLTPVLAQSWESNADQTQFTFHLDPKAVSDGSPVEAKDVNGPSSVWRT